MPTRAWTAETWAKIVGAAVAVLTLLGIVIAYGVTLKGEIQSAKATAGLTAAEKVSAVEYRVTILEVDTGNHKASQAKREEKLDATLDDLRRAVEIVNTNVAILGAQNEDTRRRMRPLPSRPKDLKP